MKKELTKLIKHKIKKLHEDMEMARYWIEHCLTYGYDYKKYEKQWTKLMLLIEQWEKTLLKIQKIKTI